MSISDAILLMRAVCNRKHYSLSTEKTYTHWLRRFGLFLKAHKLAATTPEQKMEAFLTRLAAQGAGACPARCGVSPRLLVRRDAPCHPPRALPDHRGAGATQIRLICGSRRLSTPCCSASLPQTTAWRVTSADPRSCRSWRRSSVGASAPGWRLRCPVQGIRSEG